MSLEQVYKMSFEHKEVWDRLPIAPERARELYLKAIKIQQEQKYEGEKKCCNQENSEVDAAPVESAQQANTTTGTGILPTSSGCSNDYKQ